MSIAGSTARLNEGRHFHVDPIQVAAVLFMIAVAFLAYLNVYLPQWVVWPLGVLVVAYVLLGGWIGRLIRRIL